MKSSKMSIITIVLLAVVSSTSMILDNIEYVSATVNNIGGYLRGEEDGCHSTHLHYGFVKYTDTNYTKGFAYGVKLCTGTFNPNYLSPW